MYENVHPNLALVGTYEAPTAFSVIISTVTYYAFWGTFKLTKEITERETGGMEKIKAA